MRELLIYLTAIDVHEMIGSGHAVVKRWKDAEEHLFSISGILGKEFQRFNNNSGRAYALFRKHVFVLVEILHDRFVTKTADKVSPTINEDLAYRIHKNLTTNQKVQNPQ